MLPDVPTLRSGTPQSQALNKRRKKLKSSYWAIRMSYCRSITRKAPEVTISASLSELRAIAHFLLASADEMEIEGNQFKHEHFEFGPGITQCWWFRIPILRGEQR